MKSETSSNDDYKETVIYMNEDESKVVQKEQAKCVRIIRIYRNGERMEAYGIID